MNTNTYWEIEEIETRRKKYQIPKSLYPTKRQVIDFVDFNFDCNEFVVFDEAFAWKIESINLIEEEE